MRAQETPKGTSKKLLRRGEVGIYGWLTSFSRVYRTKCKRVTCGVFVALFVVGTAISLPLRSGTGGKKCHCEVDDGSLDCCREGTGWACPGQCACGRFPIVCEEKTHKLEAGLALIVWAMGLTGTVGLIGALVCLCCICCCDNQNRGWGVEQHQFAQPHMPDGVQLGYPVSEKPVRENGH